MSDEGRGANLLSCLDYIHGVDVSNDDMTKINNRTPIKRRAGTRPAPTEESNTKTKLLTEFPQEPIEFSPLLLFFQRTRSLSCHTLYACIPCIPYK